ncbi:hypothetical protein Q3G72_000169 [Acer saccharum]|nr:hypothetical protein Q3G72_000169 [Acer saccharum]
MFDRHTRHKLPFPKLGGDILTRWINNSKLINHGVSTSLVEKVKVEIQEFFKLPIEEKKKYCQQAGDIEGYGQAFVVSEEQKLDWADKFGSSPSPLI